MNESATMVFVEQPLAKPVGVVKTVHKTSLASTNPYSLAGTCVHLVQLENVTLPSIKKINKC